MFKIYLSRKLHKDESTTSDTNKHRNRRLFERFDVSEQHLLALNDEDILRIKDLSAKGFACEVSARAYERFNLSDVYEAKLRYLGTSFEVELKVAWKGTDQVGFELLNPQEETLSFFKRLLLPMEVASSLQIVDAGFMKENDEKKTWYHGDSDTDFILWRDDKENLDAWQLISSEQFVEWNKSGGLQTGTLQSKKDSASLLGNPKEQMIPDEAPNPERIRFAVDVMMALRNDDSKEVLPTLTETSWDFESENTSTDES